MPKTQVSFRLGDVTRRKLEVLTEMYGTKTSAIAVAIDRLYLAEVGERLPSNSNKTEEEPDSLGIG